jgi:hypothetical protein
MSRQSLSKNEKAMNILRECVLINCTDEKIQKKLLDECGHEWAINTIRKNRRKIGAIKNPGEQSFEINSKQPLSIPPPNISEEEKADWFRDDFKRSHLFPVLKKQFSEEEVAIYIEEYGRLCCQFEDIVASEFFQIDKFLKHRVLINSQLVLRRMLQKEIGTLTLWLENNPIVENESAEKKQERVHITLRLDNKHTELKHVNERYDKLVSEVEKMSKSLSATRKDRIEQLAGGKENFFKLVSLLQHSRTEREKQGRYAELTKLAAEDSMRELRKPTQFPDGDIDTVITDHESVLTENE